MILNSLIYPIHIAEIVNDFTQLGTSRTVVIRFLEADATVERITARVKDALSCDEPITLTGSQRNERVDSDGGRGRLHDQKLTSNLWFLINIHVYLKYRSEVNVCPSV